MPRDVEVEEPNVVPLINLSLVILCMLMTVAAGGVRTLPVLVPRAERSGLVDASEAAWLTVGRGGVFTLRTVATEQGPAYQAETSDADELVGLLHDLPSGTIVTLQVESGVRYGALARALDCIMALADLKVAFGQTLPGGPGPGAADGATSRPAA